MHSVEFAEYISLSQNRHKFIENMFDVNKSQRPSMGVFHKIGSICSCIRPFCPKKPKELCLCFCTVIELIVVCRRVVSEQSL